MLIGSTHTARRTLGPEAKIIPITIVEAVHLLLDDVGDLAYRALEELRLLENRETNFTVAKAANYPLKALLNILPIGGLIGKYVIHTSNCL